MLRWLKQYALRGLCVKMVKTVCVKRLKQYALRGSCDKRVKTACVKRLKVCIKRVKRLHN